MDTPATAAAITALPDGAEAPTVPDSHTPRAPESSARADSDAESQKGGTLDSRAAWALRWGQLLRTARQVSGLTLAQVSADSGLSKGYLSKLESGAPAAANPSRATLAALARVLPVFRPLAHALEPAYDTADLDYAAVTPHPSAQTQTARHEMDHLDAPPPSVLQLGWRELEIVAILVVLESAAIPLPITAPILSRASGRTVAALRPTLKHLIAQSMVIEDLPARPGGAATYRRTPESAERMGIARLGDILVLAATMLIGSPTSATAGRVTTTVGHNMPAQAHRAAESEGDG